MPTAQYLTFVKDKAPASCYVICRTIVNGFTALLSQFRAHLNGEFLGNAHNYALPCSNK